MAVEREALPVCVYIGAKGHVVIRQETIGGEATIALHPYQVDLLLRWLQETKEEAIAQMARLDPEEDAKDA